jgi:hypothetical protein
VQLDCLLLQAIEATMFKSGARLRGYDGRGSQVSISLPGVLGDGILEFSAFKYHLGAALDSSNDLSARVRLRSGNDCRFQVLGRRERAAVEDDGVRDKRIGIGHRFSTRLT